MHKVYAGWIEAKTGKNDDMNSRIRCPWVEDTAQAKARENMFIRLWNLVLRLGYTQPLVCGFGAIDAEDKNCASVYISQHPAVFLVDSCSRGFHYT